jgi:isoleucyl-tRNA synthetase
VLNADSLQRRAAQTVLYSIISGLTQLIAPVLSFTAEEIWQNLNRNNKKEESIFLSPWPKVKDELVRKDIEKKWGKLLAIRKDVLKALEISRKDGKIGNSLQGQVDIYTEDKEIYNYLLEFKGQLEIVFIVSKVNVINNNNYNENENVFNGEEVPELSVVIKKAPGQKCERCWCYSETVGENSQNPTICQKCVNVLKEMNQSK